MPLRSVILKARSVRRPQHAGERTKAPTVPSHAPGPERRENPMNRLMLIAVVATTSALVGCNEPPPGSRYQIGYIGEHGIVRLDTHTGEMRRFVAALGGDVAAPSQVRIVFDQALLEGCVELGHIPSPEAAKDITAAMGGDTAYFGKNKALKDAAWAYKCKAAPALVPPQQSSSERRSPR